MKLEDLNIQDKELLENLKKVIQGAEDTVRTEYSKKLKELEKKLPKQKSKEELSVEERLKAIEERERQADIREQKLNAEGILKDKGLDTKLSKYLSLDGVEDLETYINEVAEVIGKQSKGNNYNPKGHKSSNSVITKDQFKAMSLMEKQKLYETDKETYLALTKE